jgi:hypothetical protein
VNDGRIGMRGGWVHIAAEVGSATGQDGGWVGHRPQKFSASAGAAGQLIGVGRLTQGTRHAIGAGRPLGDGGETQKLRLWRDPPATHAAAPGHVPRWVSYDACPPALSTPATSPPLGESTSAMSATLSPATPASAWWLSRPQ